MSKSQFVLCVIMTHFSDSLVNLDRIREMRGDERIENALSIAKKYFRVSKLLQAKGNTDYSEITNYRVQSSTANFWTRKALSLT
jgi:hypothetical protein